MNWRRAASPVAGLVAGVLVVAAAVAPASAHERRTTDRFQFTVGWTEEPAYTGVKNSVQVVVSEANGDPVTDLGDSLRVEVTKGSDKIVLPLEASSRVGAFGTPGEYRAVLTPTRPGTYNFRVVGSVRGQAVDESFTSSETTFDDVEDARTIQFPATDPSPGQLATRIEREVPRFDARADALERRVTRATVLAIAALVVGALGLLAGTVAWAAARRLRSAGAAPEPRA